MEQEFTKKLSVVLAERDEHKVFGEELMQNLTARAIVYDIAWVVFLWTFGYGSLLAQSPDDFPVPESYQVEGVPPIKKSEVEHLFFEPGTVRSNLIWDADRKNRRLLITDQTNNIYLLSSPLAQPEKLVEKFRMLNENLEGGQQLFPHS